MPPATTRYPLPRPFLKWAGGKGQLLKSLMKQVRRAGAFRRYHEPFVGGGALFFELYRREHLGEMRPFLSDSNVRLIEAYQGVQAHVDRVINLLKAHRACHSKEHYYKVRAEVPEDPVMRAARLIYLNRTCFNGLYRENSRGEFNVPMGRYQNPRILDADNLRAVSEALSHAEVEQRHFATVLDRAQEGDFVYFDPPYHPLSDSSSFTAYHQDGFGEEQQRELAAVFAELDRRGVKVLLSNSMTPLIRAIYASYEVETVLANRAVNSRADRRGKIPEVLVRNF